MIVNGKNIEQFGALVFDFKLPEMSFETSYLHLQEVFLLMAQRQTGSNGMVQFLIQGDTVGDVKKQVSLLKNELKSATISDVEDDPFSYSCVIVEPTDTDLKGVDVMTGKETALFTVELYCYDRYSRIIVANGNGVTHDGSAPTSPIITITPTASGTLNLQINGQTYTIVSVTEGQPLVIDAEAKTVKQGGQNKMRDVRFFKFPKLLPGLNTITSNLAGTIQTVTKARWV